MSYLRKLRALLVVALMAAGHAQPLAAQDVRSVQQIEQEIVRSQELIKLAHSQLEQLLLTEIPKVQSALETEQSQSMLNRLDALREQASVNAEKLARLNNQLERSRGLLVSKRQEIEDSSQQLAALQGNMQRSLATAQAQDTELKKKQQELMLINGRIEAAQLEADQVQNQIQRIDADVNRRNQQAIDLVRIEADHQRVMQSRQEKLDSVNKQLKALRKELSRNDRKIKSGQGKLDKTDRNIASRERQQQDISMSIQAAETRLAELTEQTVAKRSELEALQLANQSRKAELDRVKEQLSDSRKRDKATAKQVRAEQRELADSDKLVDQQNALRQQIIQDTEDSKRSILALQQNELDMRAEIEQLKKFIVQKIQAVAPLKREVEALRAVKEKSLENQSLQEQRVQSVNEALIATDVRFQELAREQRKLESERSSLMADSQGDQQGTNPPN